MSIFEKNRWEVFSAAQHPFRHSASEFAYAHPSLPGITNLESAINWFAAVLYPRSKPAVATPAALPLLGNTLLDYRVVNDDGDGKAASYRWEQREGDASPQWYKIFDMDWGVDSVLSQFLLNTQDLYVYKRGYDDIDDDGNLIAGTFAGQTIYGGATANKNLTLRANSGDGVGPRTGFVQVDDNFRPAVDSLFDIGTNTERWNKGWFDDLRSGTLNLTSGLITDSSGAISFDNENLSTTGTITSGTLTIAGGSITDTSGAISFGNENLTTTGDFTSNKVTANGAASSFASGTTVGNLTLSNGLITDSSGQISFDNENLLTTGNITGAFLFGSRLDVDNIRLDGNTVSILNANGNLNLIANGTGVVDIQSAMTTIGQTVTGVVDITGSFECDNISIDGNAISTVAGALILDSFTNEIQLLSHMVGGAANTYDLGSLTNGFKDLYLISSLKNATQEFINADIFALRNHAYRDSGRTIPAGVGDTLFWTGTQWLASVPDTEIDHGSISGLLDDDHTQYALLAGRSGGQTLIGGTAASNNLFLESTSNVTKGSVQTKDNFLPFTDTTLDIGGASNRFKDLYLYGQAKGLRAENFATFGGFPAASALTPGRLAWDFAGKDLYSDVGGTWQRLNYEKYINQDSTNWDGIITTFTYTVSADIADARFAMWTFSDNANNFEQMFPRITKTITQVTFAFDSPIPAGTYTIVGVA